MAEEIREDDYIYIVYNFNRKWLKKVKKDGQFHFDKGYIDYNDIIGKPMGYRYKISTGKWVAILPPTFLNIIYNMKRASQIIYPEDIGLILMYGGVRHGFNILEAGTGSASLTGAMAKMALPDGHIDTFEIRDVAYKQAKKNVKMMGFEKIISMHFRDVREYLKENVSVKYDFMMFDLPNTWDIIPYIKEAMDSGKLTDNARICLFNPVIEQIVKNIRVLNRLGFKNFISIEMLRRTFQVKPNATRPLGRMIGHTGYLTFVATDPEKPILDKDFGGIYSPENLGSLILYGDIDIDKRVLVITGKKENVGENEFHSTFSKIIRKKFGDDIVLREWVIGGIRQKLSKKDGSVKWEKYEWVLTEEDLSSLSIIMDDIGPMDDSKGDSEDSPDNSNGFDTIIIDNVYHNNLVENVGNLLKPGGIIGAVHDSINGMKRIHDQLFECGYYEIVSFELIKRYILWDERGVFSVSHISREDAGPGGYLTFGRKVIHTKVESDNSVLTEDNGGSGVDNAVIGTMDLPEFSTGDGDSGSESEKEKIDWGQLRDEDPL